MRHFQDINEPELVEALKNGAVGVLPTDTTYDLVCRAADEQAATRLYRLAQREHESGTVIAAKIQQLINLGLRARYLKAVESFWPSAISIVIPTAELHYLRQAAPGLAVRIPSGEAIHELLLRAGPLLTVAASRPDEPVAGTVTEAQTCFGDTVDFYVDGDDLSGRLPSTLVRIVDDAIEVLRQGSVKVDEVGHITG